MKKLLILALLMSGAKSAQIFNAKNGQTINATVSQTELTRIEVANSQIVKAFKSAKVSIKTDNMTKQIYVLPYTKNPFNIFITDNFGNNFNLALTPSKNKGGDSIIIIPPKVNKKPQIQNMGVNSDYSRNINYLLQSMYMSKEDGFEVHDINKELLIWKNLKTVYLKEFKGLGLKGVILRLRNNDRVPLTLNEASFTLNNALAIALIKPVLSPGESGDALIILKDNE